MEINKELIEYIEKHIFPVYQKNDEAHNLEHIKYVIDRSLKFASTVKNIDYNMVYTIAAYHDIAHHIDARMHEKLSAEILLADDNLLRFFSMDQIKEMAVAVYDHRASSKLPEPRTIYGKIVSSADRNVILEAPLKRTYEFRKKHSPNLTLDEMIEESRQHIMDKYGKKGYAKKKMYFKDEDYKKFLKEIKALVKDQERFKQKFLEVNGLTEVYQTLNYYNQNAKAYNEKTKNADMQKQYERFIFYLPEKAYILDFGCGSGRDSKFFIEHGYEVTAIDGSEKMCEMASKNIGQEVKCMRFDQLSDESKYDGIWACSSILHVERENLPDILRRLIRALKEDGVIYTTFKIGDKCEVRGGRFFNDMTKELLEKMLEELEMDAKIVEYYTNASSINDDIWGNYYIKRLKGR